MCREDDDGRGVMYGDYFDDDAESDMAEDDAEEGGPAAAGAADDDWDGQQMYDTGEGRAGALLDPFGVPFHTLA